MVEREIYYCSLDCLTEEEVYLLISAKDTPRNILLVSVVPMHV